MPKLVEMRTALGRTFGLEVIHKNRHYLYVEKEDAFYESKEGLPKIQSKKLIKELKLIIERRSYGDRH